MFHSMDIYLYNLYYIYLNVHKFILFFIDLSVANARGNILPVKRLPYIYQLFLTLKMLGHPLRLKVIFVIMLDYDL